MYIASRLLSPNAEGHSRSGESVVSERYIYVHVAAPLGADSSNRVFESSIGPCLGKPLDNLLDVFEEGLSRFYVLRNAKIESHGSIPSSHPYTSQWHHGSPQLARCRRSTTIQDSRSRVPNFAQQVRETRCRGRDLLRFSRRNQPGRNTDTHVSERAARIVPVAPVGASRP